MISLIFNTRQWQAYPPVTHDSVDAVDADAVDAVFSHTSPTASFCQLRFSTTFICATC